MARVHWAEAARREFWEVVDNLAELSPRAALAVADDLEAAADRLTDYPRLGRVVPEYQHDALRELIVREYRLLYRLAEDEAKILTVVHGSRDLWRHLPEGPWDIE